MKKKEYSELTVSAFTQQIFNIFVDAWILMLSLGGLSHILKLPINLSYRACLLVVIISICLIPQNNLIIEIMKENYKNGNS